MAMKYIIEFELPDNETVLKDIKTDRVNWSIWGYSGQAKAKPALKEQEAVPVVQREFMHLLFWCCGSCGVAITHGDKFCRNCGKAVKWK